MATRRGLFQISHHSRRVSFTRHLIVDGANLIHAWKDLHALAKRDRQAARTELVKRLAPIHDLEKMRVTVVFDGRGDELRVERPSGEATFSVVYTPGSMTGDDVIEQMVANSATPSTCIVCTEDRAERETVMATGATAIRADDLSSWIQRTETRQRAAIATLKSDNVKSWGRR
jgi:predicted RNA-binding protein with PIN domain